MAAAFVVVALHMTGHSLTVRVFPKEMSREVDVIRTTVSQGTAYQ